MARMKKGHLVGKLGPTVTVVINGVEVTRIVPAHFNDPLTNTQRIQRTKMKFTSKIITALKTTIDAGYQGTTADNPSNEARSFISRNCFSVQDMNVTIHYDQIMVSRGELPKAEDYALAFNDDLVTITWKIPGPKSGTGDHKVNIIMYSDVGDRGVEWHHFVKAERKTGTITIHLPKSDMPIHFWLFFHCGDISSRPSKGNISDSVYLGSYPAGNNEQVIDAMSYVKKK